MKIGIFGGCFNPPHNMHKKIGLELIEKGYIDKLIYMPTGDHYPKKDLASGEDRYEMLIKMLENEKSIEISKYEIEHKSYTYETLTYLQNQYKNDKIYFISGIDNLIQFSTWKNYIYILNNFHLLVINRNNKNIEEVMKKYIEFKDHITIIPMDTEVLSSTEIRKLLKEGNPKVKEKLDKKVLHYINEKNLYRK